MPMTKLTLPHDDLTGHSPLHIRTDEAATQFDEKMKEIDLKEKERLTQEHAQELGLGYINLRGFPIEPLTLLMIAEAQAKELHMLPFFSTGKEIRVAAVNPEDHRVVQAVDDLAAQEHAHVELYLVSPNSFSWAFRLYANAPVVKKQMSGVAVSAESLKKFQAQLTSFQDLHDKIRKVPISDVISIILAGAVQMSASDIHLEAEEEDVKLRYRIDGALQTVAVLSRETWPKIISRIKLLAHLKINVNNQPQDGRVTIYMDKENIDVRVSTIPSAYGESIVMRLLMSATAGIKFEQLGLRGNPQRILEQQMHRPNGMIITTGPTSSGKTTTLYAILTKLNTTERKIITLEDPVEYHLSGISQSQIDHSQGYTFAKGLKAILRQNPDIVMLGEIRDEETADIAIHAALTGHLLISTLHTNDAAGAVPRFLAMGIKPFLLAPALNAVIAQRLVRKICEYCKEELALAPDVLERVRKTLADISPKSGEKVDLDNLHFYHGKGCEKCHGIGLKGRIGIYEIFTMNSEIEKVILSEQVSEYVMRDIGVKNGMVLMVQDGLLKALDGITTVDEVFRVARAEEE